MTSLSWCSDYVINGHCVTLSKAESRQKPRSLFPMSGCKTWDAGSSGTPRTRVGKVGMLLSSWAWVSCSHLQVTLVSYKRYVGTTAVLLTLIHFFSGILLNQRKNRRVNCIFICKFDFFLFLYFFLFPISIYSSPNLWIHFVAFS